MIAYTTHVVLKARAYMPLCNTHESILSFLMLELMLSLSIFGLHICMYIYTRIAFIMYTIYMYVSTIYIHIYYFGNFGILTV